MATKEKIMKAATQLFNEKGYGSVNLKELAQAIGISRGNLTYHFKNKEVLLAAIVKKMWAKIDQERQKTRQFPTFENMRNQTQLVYNITTPPLQSSDSLTNILKAVLLLLFLNQ